MNDQEFEDLQISIDHPFKNKYRKIANWEESILSCILQKPELINEMKVTPDDFHQYPRMLKYFINFYKTFGMLDMVLMVNKLASKQRKALVGIFDTLIDFEPSTSAFLYYQDGLLQYNKEKAEEIALKKRRDIIRKLIVKFVEDEIDLEEFKRGVGGV